MGLFLTLLLNRNCSLRVKLQIISLAASIIILGYIQVKICMAYIIHLLGIILAEVPR